MVRKIKSDRSKKTGEKADSAMRMCLGPDCGRMFKSAHKFNRMCPKCKSSPKSVEWSTWGGSYADDTDHDGC